MNWEGSMYMCHPNSKYRRCYVLIRLRIHACICDRSKARFESHNYKSKATCFDGKDQTTRSRELLRSSSSTLKICIKKTTAFTFFHCNTLAYQLCRHNYLYVLYSAHHTVYSHKLAQYWPELPVLVQSE